jgi:hypothetical protein
LAPHAAIAWAIGLVVGMADGAVDLRKADLISMDFGRIAGCRTPQARSALRYDDYCFWRAAGGVTIAWTR